MPLNLNSNLQKAMETIAENHVSDYTDQVNRSGADIYDTCLSFIMNEATDTIAIKYAEYQAIMFVASALSRKVIRFEIMESEYLDFCEKLGINHTEHFNASVTKHFDGVFTRIFSLQKPVCDLPMITISTTKKPPAKWNQGKVDELIPKIMQDNFIVVGKSGAGKTYFLNYMLAHYADPNWHIAFIEEFNELIPPNDHVMQITAPPPKPDEPSKLRFLTEQSNLMRLDRAYIGEVKGPEAWPAVVNMSSGTRMGFTIHGKTWRDGLQRLQSLCMMQMDNEKVVSEFIAKAVKYVILVEDHRVKNIQELTGVSIQGKFQASEIYGVSE